MGDPGLDSEPGTKRAVRGIAATNGEISNICTSIFVLCPCEFLDFDNCDSYINKFPCS